VARIELELRADAESAEREAETRALQERLDLRLERTLQRVRVRPLEPDRDVGDRDDPVEVDDDRDQALPPLPVPQRTLEEAGLAVLPWRVQADEMAADDLGEELFRLLVPVDHVLGIDRVRVDERVDVGDHRMATAYQEVCELHTPWYARAARNPRLTRASPSP